MNDERGEIVIANVTFKQGKKKQYDALTIKDSNTLYWLEDTRELYKGEVLYATGVEATTLASGLMSAADKAKLNALSSGGTASLTAVDSSVILSTGEKGTAIGVQISKAKGNALALKEDGIFVSTASASGDAEAVFKLDTSNANGLSVSKNGLGLAEATASSAGAMSAADKAALDAVMESIVWSDFSSSETA